MARLPAVIIVSYAALLALVLASSASVDGLRGGAPTVLPPAESLSGSIDAPPVNAESFTFQAEVNRLMDIIINSLYSNRDVFLRELISNASDALDKLRFMSLTDGGEAVDDAGLIVRVTGDVDAGVLQISDTGVGMTRDELIANLGTIAKSGTSSFMEKLGKAAKEAAEAKDAGAASNLIGQFGVGFYSAYLVADRVKVESRVKGGKVNVWESGADGKFVVYQGIEETFKEEHGTKITLVLKSDAKEYVDQKKLEELIKKYSQFINFPIFLRTKTVISTVASDDDEEKESEKEGEVEKKDKNEKNDEEKDEAGEDEIKVEDADENKVDEPKQPKMKEETTFTWELMNHNKPIWTRDPTTVSEKEYANFYDGIAKLPGSPMAKSHFRGEGEVEFRSILYIPDKPPVDLYGGHAELEKDAIRLYVRRVLVTDSFEQGLLPRYLAFLVGIVDSDDLPINVSREMLQKSKTLDIIRRKLVRKALDMMKSLVKLDDDADEKAGADETEGDEKDEDGEEKEKTKKVVSRAYIKFWKLYGKSIKLGVIEDGPNRARLSKLLRFRTSKSDLNDVDDFRTLDQYLDGMKDDQDNIYYHSGESIDQISSSPFLEKLLAKGYEVIYLTEPIDEHMIMQLPDYEGSKFMSVAKDGFKFGEKDQKEEKEKSKALRKQYRALTNLLKERMSGKVSKVKLSSRLSDTPCVLSTEQYGYSARMEIVMKAQAFADPDSFKYMTPKTKIMELNPHHPLIRKMLEDVKAIEGKENDEKKKGEDSVVEFGNLIHDTALISGGYLVQDTADFSKRMYRWISSTAGVDAYAKLEDVVPEQVKEGDEEDSDDKMEDMMDDMAGVPGMENARVMKGDELGDMAGAASLGGDSEGGAEAHDEL